MANTNNDEAILLKQVIKDLSKKILDLGTEKYKLIEQLKSICIHHSITKKRVKTSPAWRNNVYEVDYPDNITVTCDTCGKIYSD